MANIRIESAFQLSQTLPDDLWKPNLRSRLLNSTSLEPEGFGVFLTMSEERDLGSFPWVRIILCCANLLNRLLGFGDHIRGWGFQQSMVLNRLPITSCGLKSGFLYGVVSDDKQHHNKYDEAVRSYSKSNERSHLGSGVNEVFEQDTLRQ
ncbi:hypothetical protein ACO22_07075 [Paracoccidioides brasiliensis]|uniref:Uncharacterized protein n=1 Tax=Paracoccidioides brasiliensis TaxID=121759 RepID=A0A1D2J5R5_PARBR|nr:hypothetical protein ACO22_07075 [Paracoccidioides brasiliensis]